MPDFYVLNNVPVVEAESPEGAARRFAQQAGITSGVVLIAKGVQSFDVTTSPPVVDVKASVGDP